MGLVLKYVISSFGMFVCRGQNIWLSFLQRGMVIKPMIGLNIPTHKEFPSSDRWPCTIHPMFRQKTTHMLAQAKHYMPMIFAPLPSHDYLIYFQCLDGREGARFLTCLYSSTSLYVVAFICCSLRPTHSRNVDIYMNQVDLSQLQKQIEDYHDYHTWLLYIRYVGNLSTIGPTGQFWGRVQLGVCNL